MTSPAPVFDMQIRNQIEIGAIAGDQRRTMCNGDGGNAQVVRSDPDFLDSPRLKELLGGVCIRKIGVKRNHSGSSSRSRSRSAYISSTISRKVGSSLNMPATAAAPRFKGTSI